MFGKILIANRGEIALRIQRACRDLGIQTVMVYSDADIDAKYLRLADESVCIGPAPVSKSYLDPTQIISAAAITGADAIHPGYGLLSENPNFAEQVRKSGFTFIGPPSEIIRLMGDKIAAKEAAKKYGLKILSGTQQALPKENMQATAAVAEVGFPVVIKAAAGGGGRGMRIVNTEIQTSHVLPVLRQEAKSAFGDDTLYAERYLNNPRHIEVQVLSDEKKSIHLGTRDCSLQRRHQKIVEEAPAPNIPKKKEEALCNACVQACRKMGYIGAGTFEFLYDGDDFYFIEMNTRLQVEHPITECITGVDIVAEQIRIAAGEGLSYRQKDIHFHGHAIECRINAEDPNTFLPAPGKIDFYHPPGGLGVRIDSHIYTGYGVPPFYDSLIAKLIIYANTREAAIIRTRSALREFLIEGIGTNLALHAKLMEDVEFCQGNVGIRHLESYTKPK